MKGCGHVIWVMLICSVTWTNVVSHGRWRSGSITDERVICTRYCAWHSSWPSFSASPLKTSKTKNGMFTNLASLSLLSLSCSLRLLSLSSLVSLLSTLLAMSIYVTFLAIPHFIVYHLCYHLYMRCSYIPWSLHFIVHRPYSRCSYIPWVPYFVVYRSYTHDTCTYHRLLSVWGSLRLTPIS